MTERQDETRSLISPPDFRSLGPRIAERRAAKGWKQRELARRSGIEASRLSRLERGISLPRVDELARLRSVLGSTVDALLFGDDLGEVGRSLESLGWTLEEVEALDRLLRVLARRSCGSGKAAAGEGRP